MNQEIMNINSGNTGLAGIEEQRALAQIQAKVILAKKFPRKLDGVLQDVKAACSSIELALAAEYTYSRGDTEVRGLSIRMAECLAQNYGNFLFGWEEVFRATSLDQGTPGFSEIMAYAWDIERNTYKETKFRIEHVRHTKSGGRILTAERDIYENNANNASRRVRACILALIPQYLQERAKVYLAETLRQIAPEAQVKKLLKAFSDKGVTAEMLERYLQHTVAAINLEEIDDLRGIYNSIRDGISDVKDWFVTEEEKKTGQKPTGNLDAEKTKETEKNKKAKTPPEPFKDKNTTEDTSEPVKSEPDPIKSNVEENSEDVVLPFFLKKKNPGDVVIKLENGDKIFWTGLFDQVKRAPVLALFTCATGNPACLIPRYYDVWTPDNKELKVEGIPFDGAIELPVVKTLPELTSELMSPAMHRRFCIVKTGK